MALEEQVTQQEQNLSGDEVHDLRIATTIAKNLIDDGGSEVIDRAVATSKDAGQVIGQFLLQLGAEMGRNLPEGVALSPRIWLAQGGVLEQVSDYIQDEYDVPREVMDRAEMFVASAIQQQAQQEQQQAAPQQAPAMQGGLV